LNHFESPSIAEKKVQREHNTEGTQQNQRAMRTNQTILGRHIIIFKIPTSPRQHPNNSSSAMFRRVYSLLIMPPKTCSNASHKPRAGDMVLPTPSHSQDAAIGDVSEPQPKSKTTKHTSGKHAYATGSDMETNPTKRKETTEPKPTSLPAAKPKAKEKPIPKAREQLPKCNNRNDHSGKIDQPRKKRTPAKVAMDNAARKEVKCQLVELEEEEKRLYAQMEIDDNEKELARQVNAVRRLSNHVQVDRGDMESSEGEEFNMDVDMSEAEDVDEETEDQIMTVSFVQHIQLGQIE
jgi:hypothetical protein